MTPICEAEGGRISGWFAPRAQAALLTCACAGATAFLFAVDPNRHAVYPQCLLYRATGLYCAGCGATRALYALLHGRILEAAHDNALFIVALPFFLWLAGSYLARTWRMNAWPRYEMKPRALMQGAAAIFLVMLIFMVARNLPGWPFDLLKPLSG
jgi:hypothetical protein